MVILNSFPYFMQLVRSHNRFYNRAIMRAAKVSAQTIVKKRLMKLWVFKQQVTTF